MAELLAADVNAVAQIAAVPTILEVVCRTSGMGFAAIARVTPERWVACGVRDEIGFGLLPGGELEVDTTICNDIRVSGKPVVIDDVALDSIFRGHHTPARYGFQSYISMPIMLADGSFFGTLCAIDPRPMRLSSPETVGMFRLFADLIGFHLDAQRRVAASEASLIDERQGALLREQFVAVLGHDLRNPLAAIDAGARLLERSPLDEQGRRVVGQIQSSVRRMAGLIGDVLDFARGRLGGGLVLDRDADEPLGPLLEQVVAELRSVRPGRQVLTELTLDRPVDCDRARIGQLLSNLVDNALTHGAADAPVLVRAMTDDGWLELSVVSRGEPIPATTIEHLFKPFFRASTGPRQQGLGLGLYIAAEIARAHDGTLTGTSSPEETRFTFRMPRTRSA